MDRQAKKGIWRHAQFFPPISPEYQLTLNEGGTTLREIEKIYFKCEYENPTGSVKDRGMAYQISTLFSKGIKKAVLSSSGNAAISAAHYTKLTDIDLTVFVAENINQSKFDHLSKFHLQIFKSRRPVSDSINYARKNNFYNLRSSTDPVGHIGFSTIAFELNDEVGLPDAIFFPVSSGTTLAGVTYGFRKLGFIPKLFAIQTERIHPIAEDFDNQFKPSAESIADAIVARFTPREAEVKGLIKKSGGGGFVISDKEILQAAKWLKAKKINCSYEGALSLAGLFKAQAKGNKFNKPVCLLTGKIYD